MQNINYTTLNALVPNAGDTARLKDTRDGKKYTVAKLADGNVWMTQNLRFTGTNLTPADTNVASNKTLNYYDLKGGSNSYDQAGIHDGTDTPLGVYYNYAAATAETITGSNDTAEATEDICPAGWRLPTSTEETGITSYVSAFNPTYGGYYYNGSYSNNNAGGFWSSTASNSSSRYYLRYESNALSVYSPTSGRYLGIFVRCIYNKSTTMQGFTSAEASAMSIGESKTLTDVRDNQDYTVTKLSDGNVWMTRNLAIGCNGKGSNYGSTSVATALTSADSDVASFTTPTASVAGATSYTTAKQLCNANYGAYYNYAAASAGTINTSSSTVEATSSICPKGWKLPTWAEQTAITGYVSQYNPSLGGYTNGANPGYTSYGFWWSATANGGTARHALRYYNGHTSMDNGASTEERTLGFFVRCIKTENR